MKSPGPLTIPERVLLEETIKRCGYLALQRAAKVSRGTLKSVRAGRPVRVGVARRLLAAVAAMEGLVKPPRPPRRGHPTGPLDEATTEERAQLEALAADCQIMAFGRAAGVAPDVVLRLRRGQRVMASTLERVRAALAAIEAKG